MRSLYEPVFVTTKRYLAVSDAVIVDADVAAVMLLPCCIDPAIVTGTEFERSE